MVSYKFDVQNANIKLFWHWVAGVEVDQNSSIGARKYVVVEVIWT